MTKYEVLKDMFHPLTREPLKTGRKIDLDERAARYVVLKGDLALHVPAAESKTVRRSAKTEIKAN